MLKYYIRGIKIKMFRKIVSNLPFSPAIVGQLGFYAKRLRKEEATRRLTLMFVVLALIVQSFAVFQPAESANASSDSAFISTGISSINDFLSAYDSNSRHLKDVMNYAGITRAEIAATKYTTWVAGDTLNYGYKSHYGSIDGETEYKITDSNGNYALSVYSWPYKLFGPDGANTKLSGWVGNSSKIGWFAIKANCGNLMTQKILPAPEQPKCAVNSDLLASDENCKTCSGDSTLWYKDPMCAPNVEKTKTATNVTQGFFDATTVTANTSDRISYTLTIANTGTDSATVKISDYINDTLEYATLIDDGGGTFDETTKTLSWPDITLEAKSKQTRTFVVKIKDPIPTTAQGASDETSYDCKMTNAFGNSTDININCPVVKTVETATTELPTTGPTENMIFAGVILAIATYFYARTKQTNKEIRLIRKNINIGAI